MKNKRIYYKPEKALFSQDVEMLRFLSKHKRGRIRINVARNENTPIDILYSMLDDKNIEVLIAIALRCSTFDLFKILMDKNNHEINVALSKNENLPKIFQMKLLEDDKYVSYFMHIGKKTSDSSIIDYILDFKYYRNKKSVYLQTLYNSHLNIKQFEKIFDSYKNRYSYSSLFTSRFLNDNRSTKKMLLHIAEIHPSLKTRIYTKLGLNNFI